MTIPKHNEIRFFILKHLANGEAKRAKDLERPLAKHFQLTDVEIEEMYPTGNGPIFLDRITFAMSFLFRSNYADKPERGLYQISEKGINLLKRSDAETFLRAEPNRNKDTTTINQDEIVYTKDEEKTPLEALSESFSIIKNEICDNILQTIIKKSSREFEHLVVMLLEKMGYGGQVKNAGEVTQATNDEGIDGIIKEDILGLGRIHIQAKKYDVNNSVGREEIQKFVGALATRSAKGVFITTSYYSKGAIEYAENIPALVLINGEQLAEYIYDFNLGMQVEQVIEIKKLDSDFWD